MNLHVLILFSSCFVFGSCNNACNFNAFDRESCPGNGSEYTRKSLCEPACCWSTIFNNVPNCFLPQQQPTTTPYIPTTSSCTECTTTPGRSIPETAEELVASVIGGSNEEATKNLFSNAFANASDSESRQLVANTLVATQKIYDNQTSNNNNNRASVEQLAGIFNSLKNYVTTSNNAKLFLETSAYVLTSEVLKSETDRANQLHGSYVINALEEHGRAMATTLLGNETTTAEATSATVALENITFIACYENVNKTGCDVTNKNVTATMASKGNRSYVSSVIYDRDFAMKLLPANRLATYNATLGSSLISMTSFTGREQVTSVNVTLRFNAQINGDNRDETCAFLTEDADWSVEGCSVTEQSEESPRWFCNHNTSFALLFLHTDIEITAEEQAYFEIITYIGSGTSITALLVTIFCFFYLKLTRIKRVILHLNLSVTLCVGQIILLIGTKVTVGTPFCKAIAVLLHFFFMSSFSWMLMEGILLYFQSARAVKGEVNFKLMIVFGWILPLLIVGVSLASGYEGYGSDRGCWLSIRNGLTWAFIGPALGFILVNSILLGLIVNVFLKLKSNAKSGEWQRTKRSVRAIVLLTPLLGLTWVFGALAVNEDTKWFLYLFSICNSLQGLAIFIFHCLHNHDVRKAFLKKYRHSFQNIPPFFSSVNPTSTGKTFVKTTSGSSSTPSMSRKQ